MNIQILQIFMPLGGISPTKYGGVKLVSSTQKYIPVGDDL